MLNYVTTNPGKVREAEDYLDAVTAVDFDYPELQSSTLEPIGAHGARTAYRAIDAPVIVDDAGLFIEGLDGFPGPYSSFVESTLGVERVSEIARRADATRASFRCVIAYCDGESFDATPEPIDQGRRGDDLAVADRATAATDETVDAAGLPVKLFTGVMPGRIVEPRGDGGFGYDPIFEHDGKTLAELETAEKNAISHRGRALAKFAEWFDSR